MVAERNWGGVVPLAHHHTRPKDHAVSPRADRLLRLQLLQVEANSSPQDRRVFVSPSLMFTRHSPVLIGTIPSSSFTLSQTSSRCFWKDLCKSGQKWLTFRGKKSIYTWGMGRSQKWSALGFRTTHMGFFLFINSFYVFSILSLKTAVSLSSLSHLPVISDFHVLIYRSELHTIRAEPKVIFFPDLEFCFQA